MPTPEARRERRRRDKLVILCAAMALGCLIATITVGWTTLANRADLLDQKAGRGIALDVVCASSSATAEAGRAVITGQLSGGSAAGSDEFTRFLEAHGYPPREVRARAARQAGIQYARRIAQRVQEESGVAGLVQADGSLNCDRLKAVAKAGGR